MKITWFGTKIVVSIVLMSVFVIYSLGFMTRFTNSYNGDIDFPEGCWNKYPENITFSGQFVKADKEYCYTKIFRGYDPDAKFLFSSGRNTYEHIKWERVIV